MGVGEQSSGEAEDKEEEDDDGDDEDDEDDEGDQGKLESGDVEVVVGSGEGDSENGELEGSSSKKLVKGKYEEELEPVAGPSSKKAVNGKYEEDLSSIKGKYEADLDQVGGSGSDFGPVGLEGVFSLYLSSTILYLTSIRFLPILSGALVHFLPPH